MAGEHTKMNRDIWSSDEFLDLSRNAQHLYFVLWTHPKRSFCGSVDWHPGRLAAFASDLTTDLVIESAIELARNLFVAVDLDTEEALVRSWIKHDGLYRQPNMAVAMAKDRAGLASRGLRGIVVHEVAKLVIAEPDLSGWKRDQVVSMLAQKAVNPTDFWAASPWANPTGNPSVNPSGNPSVNPLSNPGVYPGPTTATTPTTQTPTTKREGGYESSEGYDAPETEEPPTPNLTGRCDRHRNDPTPPACVPCRDARKAKEAADDDLLTRLTAIRAEDARQSAITQNLAIADCGLCDDRGYLGKIVCDHVPDRIEINQRGMDAVREQMGWES